MSAKKERNWMEIERDHMRDKLILIAILVVVSLIPVGIYSARRKVPAFEVVVERGAVDEKMALSSALASDMRRKCDAIQDPKLQLSCYKDMSNTLNAFLRDLRGTDRD